MAVLSWKHQTLIQALMSRGPINEDEFQNIFAAVTGKPPSAYPQDFNDFLLKINKELSYVQMELRCCRDQNDGQVCYGLVNNVSDEQSKLGTKYSVPQIALFKGITEAIVQNDAAQGVISTFDALNIRLENQVGTESQSQLGLLQVPPALRNFSMSQKEKTIGELVEDKWLSRTPDGDIGLGVRAYLDLRSWFHNSGVPSCEVCNEVGLKAKRCQNDGCSVRIHHYCLEKKISQNRGAISCSGCGIQRQSLKSEALEDVGEIAGPSESEAPAGLRKKRLRLNAKDADLSRCSSSQGSQPVSKRVTRSSARLK